MNLTEWIIKEDLSIKEFANQFCDVVIENFGKHNYKCVVDIINKKLNYIIIPRYFLDERVGCAAVRDKEHPKYDKSYPGLHQNTLDVVVYAHGFQNHKKRCWEMKETDINYLKLECDRLNKIHIDSLF